MDANLQRRLIERISAAICDHEAELTDLDRAIGDGDHGLNMKRGFTEVAAQAQRLGDMGTAEALQAIGKLLIMKIGGASGPLYGTLFMALGKSWPVAAPGGAADLADALGAAVEAVKRIGKSEVGQKTMLDVLAPVQRELARGGAAPAARLRACALAAAEATVALRATRGRASYLGERSIGHMDPGARSAALLVCAVCDEWEVHLG
jgi:dihydroxyacetone kinase-like protein